MKHGHKQTGTAASPDLLLHSFDRMPPEGKVCLDRIYDLFADWPIQWGWCTQCFGPEWEQRMRAHPDIRTAPHDSFDMIYFEHPLCSGGITTFLHWLPRALEISFFDNRLYPSLLNHMIRMGLFAWPEKWLVPLRQILCRVSINWFSNTDPFPFHLPSDGSRCAMKEEEIGQELIAALCAVRIDPRTVAEWLLDTDTAVGWRATLLLLRAERVLDELVYYVVADETQEASLRAAQDALDRRLRQDFHAVFKDEMLLKKWEQTCEVDPALADLLSETEWMRRVHCPISEAAQREADEEVLKRVAGLRVIDV